VICQGRLHMHMRINLDLTSQYICKFDTNNLSPFSSSLRNGHPSPLLTSPSPQYETNLYIPSFLPDFASSPVGSNTPTTPSKYQGETGAAPLSYDPCGTTLPHVEPSAHVIDKLPSLCLPPAVLRAQRQKPWMTAMVTLTWIPHKKQPIIPQSDPRPLHLVSAELSQLPLFWISGLIPVLANHSSSTQMHTSLSIVR